QANGEKLMVLGSFLGDLVIGNLEDDEVAEIGKQPVLWEQALDEGLHAAGGVGLDVKTVDAFPGGEPLHGGGPHAVEGGDAVGDDDQGIEVEEQGDFVGVVLDLVVGVVHGGLIGVGVLQLEEDQGQAVDEDEDVGAAVVLATDGELVDDLEVILGGIVPIDR